MKEETIKTLCKEKGLINPDLFVKFFMKRFPTESDDIHSYCNEWIDRFMSGSPEEHMDSQSLEIYKRCKEELSK